MVSDPSLALSDLPFHPCDSPPPPPPSPPGKDPDPPSQGVLPHICWSPLVGAILIPEDLVVEHEKGRAVCDAGGHNRQFRTVALYVNRNYDLSAIIQPPVSRV